MDDELRDAIRDMGLGPSAQSRLEETVKQALQGRLDLARQQARVLEKILATAMNRSHIEAVAAMLDELEVLHGLHWTLEIMDQLPSS